MTTNMFLPLAFAGVIALVLPACARSTPGMAGAETAAADQTNSIGVDLGPSSQVPRTQVAMAAAGHEGDRLSRTSAGHGQLVHEGGGDAHATGTVNSVDAAQHKINLSHNPIPAIGWPAMTMDFPVAPSVDLSQIKPGSRVDFSLGKDKAGMYQVESVEPAGAGR